MSTYILGISAFFHDSAAVLVKDGQIVAGAQEERFTRKKNDHQFPDRAIQYCLAQAGIGVDDLTCVAFYDNPHLKFERLMQTYLQYSPRGFETFQAAIPGWLKRNLHIPRQIREHMGYKGSLFIGEHHRSHAASAFYPSPFADAAIITMDGVGEWATTSWGTGAGNRLELHHQIDFPDSVGLLYTAFTYFLGFKVNSDEYKVMGLAPYGSPRFVRAIMDTLIDLKDDGSFRLDMDYFSYCTGVTMTDSRFEKLFGTPRREAGTKLEQVHMDLARSLQDVTEEVMLRIARHVHRQTRARNLCLAGGVALNCVGNGRISAAGIYDRIWVQPAAGDAGAALGVALYVWHQTLGNARTAGPDDSQAGSLLGPVYADDAIKSYLDQHAYPYREFADRGALDEHVAKLIDEQNVVGWFQDRLEFGPRALGARSILGDPRSATMQSTLNLKIKNRESFRPFAPAVLEDDAREFFELTDASPYMLMVAPVAGPKRKPLTALQQGLTGMEKLQVARSEIPAVTHVDDSARVQTVSEKTNPGFHRLLRSFKARTGCPVLINTSFNVADEPIVCTPSEAYRCFMKTRMDHLVMGRFALDRKQQPRIQFGKDEWDRPSETATPFTLVILGASTARGAPYGEWFDFGTLASKALGGRLAGRPLKVVNLARPGKSSSQVLAQLKEIPGDASLVLLYEGQNEFWGKFSFPSDLCNPRRRLFDRPIIGPAGRQRILGKWRKNTERIIAHCKRMGVPLMISTFGQNLGDRSPNRSVLRDSRNERAVSDLLQSHFACLREGKLESAIGHLASVLELEPTFAIAHKYLGDCLRARQNFAGAIEAYRAAIEHDGFPSVSVPSQNDTIRLLAAKHGLAVLDCERALREASPDGIPGLNLMIDEVHPNVAGYCCMATALARQLTALAGASEPIRNLVADDIARECGLEVSERVTVHRYVAFELYHWSMLTWPDTERERLDHAIRRHLEPAEAYVPGDATMIFMRVLMEARLGNLDEVRRTLRKGLHAEPLRFRRHFYPEGVFERYILQQNIRRLNLAATLEAAGILYPNDIGTRLVSPFGLAGFKAWVGLLMLTNWLANQGLLRLIFYGAVLPLGLAGRAVGFRFLQKRPRDRETYWREYKRSSEHAIEGDRISGYGELLTQLHQNGSWLLIGPTLTMISVARLFGRPNKVFPFIYTLF